MASFVRVGGTFQSGWDRNLRHHWYLNSPQNARPEEPLTLVHIPA